VKRAAKPDVFSAVADPTRRALLRMLAERGELNVGELVAPFSVSQPAISKHLRVLRGAGLVRSRSAGRARLYALDAERLHEVHDWVSYFEKYWDARLDALGNYLDKRKQKKSK
jgi:DNA-binding transcriptional ArsR family regulator